MSAVKPSSITTTLEVAERKTRSTRWRTKRLGKTRRMPKCMTKSRKIIWRRCRRSTVAAHRRRRVEKWRPKEPASTSKLSPTPTSARGASPRILSTRSYWRITTSSTRGLRTRLDETSIAVAVAAPLLRSPSFPRPVKISLKSSLAAVIRKSSELKTITKCPTLRLARTSHRCEEQ